MSSPLAFILFCELSEAGKRGGLLGRGAALGLLAPGSAL